MKITIRLTINDSMRLALGKKVAASPADLTVDKLLRKRPMVEWLQREIQGQMPSVGPVVSRPALSPVERAHLKKVYDYLSAIGHSDQYIEEWILLQRAKSDFRSLFPHVRKNDGYPFEVVG